MFFIITVLTRIRYGFVCLGLKVIFNANIKVIKWPLFKGSIKKLQVAKLPTSKKVQVQLYSLVVYVINLNG